MLRAPPLVASISINRIGDSMLELRINSGRQKKRGKEKDTPTILQNQKTELFSGGKTLAKRKEDKKKYI
jgi:hypothetical protein